MLYRCFLLVALLLAPHLAHAARIVVFGDSLSAAYGLRPEQGWVRLLQQQLGSTHQVVNSSLSGETTAGGLARLPAVLRQQRPDVLILELGGNDGLRGLPLPAMQDNLSAMVRLAQRAGARVLLIGMALPPIMAPITAPSSGRCMTKWRAGTRCRWCRCWWPASSRIWRCSRATASTRSPRRSRAWCATCCRR
ncbi:arylesterase [Vogesella fluminis]|uniref:arylesterase n=1 Tax=Vogesella fluminis TaxID=1069161 RepID=UPI003643E811